MTQGDASSLIADSHGGHTGPTLPAASSPLQSVPAPVVRLHQRRLPRFQKQLATQDLLIVNERGYVPLSKTGAEVLFEVFSQRYERSSTLVTSNLPFNEWTEILGSERMTGALLDRLTHHVHILEMNGDSFRLKQSKRARQNAASTGP